MTWYTTPHTPTLWSTLAEMAAVSRAIWRDYRDCARNRRRAARNAKRYAVPTVTPAWHNDVAFLLVGALALVVAAVTTAGGWGALVDFLARFGGVLS